VSTVSGEYTESDTFSIYMKTNVAKITPMNEEKDFFTVGTVFTTQPSVKIFDFEG
jgi:hypothetical protein